MTSAMSSRGGDLDENGLFSNKETRFAMMIFSEIRDEQWGGDLHENCCFPIRKRAAPGRNHSMKSFPAFKIDD